MSTAHPIQASMASAASFVLGGIPAIAAVLLVGYSLAIWAITVVAIVALTVLGAAGTRAGGAPILPTSRSGTDLGPEPTHSLLGKAYDLR